MNDKMMLVDTTHTRKSNWRSEQLRGLQTLTVGRGWGWTLPLKAPVLEELGPHHPVCDGIHCTDSGWTQRLLCAAV